jgi:hypothetical protein
MCTAALAALPLVPMALYYTPPGEARDTSMRGALLLALVMAAVAAPVAIGLPLAGAPPRAAPPGPAPPRAAARHNTA